MLVNHKEKWVLVTAPKTGSTSLVTLLKEKLDGDIEEHCGQHGYRQHAPAPNDPSLQLHLPSEGYRLILTTRHPLPRMVSMYWHFLWEIRGRYQLDPLPTVLEQTTFTFPWFVQWITKTWAADKDATPYPAQVPSEFYSKSQSWWYHRAMEAHRSPFRIRLENIETDIIRSGLLDTEFTMPHINATNHRPWQEYYLKENGWIVDLLKEHYSDDFGNFVPDRFPGDP